MKIYLKPARKDPRGELIIQKRIDALIDALARYGEDKSIWTSTLQLLVDVRPNLSKPRYPNRKSYFQKRQTQEEKR